MLCVIFKMPPNLIGSQYEKLIIQKLNVTLDIISDYSATTMGIQVFLPIAYRIADSRIKRKSESQIGASRS